MTNLIKKNTGSNSFRNRNGNGSKSFKSIHEKMQMKANQSQSCLEEIDSFSKITTILLRNNNGK